MATAKANIIIGGKKIDPYHVSVQQRCDWHHQFEVAVSTEKIEKVNSLASMIQWIILVRLPSCQ